MTTDGLEELRRIVAAFPEELPSLSARGGALIAAWEAERQACQSAVEEADRLRFAAEAQAAADRAALATAQHANDAERGEWSEYYELLTGDRGAWSPDDMRRAVKAQTDALAQARALAEEWITGDGETYGAKLLAEAGRRLKSVLGGAR